MGTGGFPRAGFRLTGPWLREERPAHPFMNASLLRLGRVAFSEQQRDRLFGPGETDSRLGSEGGWWLRRKTCPPGEESGFDPRPTPHDTLRASRPGLMEDLSPCEGGRKSTHDRPLTTPAIRVSTGGQAFGAWGQGGGGWS